ncbi:hypothetical protein C2E23DRAFT_343929 [Lenzites betulinus]|nr:hypothetical protein C2E23DRAFT_343929 [Lenzites betulinus]
MTATPNCKHLFVYTSYFWGHAHPLCLLVVRVVKMRPDITITFVVLKSLHSRVELEVARELSDESLLDRIRTIALEDGKEPRKTSGAHGTFKALWSRILRSGEALVCAKTGMQFGALSVCPTVVLLDEKAVYP